MRGNVPPRLPIIRIHMRKHSFRLTSIKRSFDEHPLGSASGDISTRYTDTGWEEREKRREGGGKGERERKESGDQGQNPPNRLTDQTTDCTQPKNQNQFNPTQPTHHRCNFV